MSTFCVNCKHSTTEHEKVVIIHPIKREDYYCKSLVETDVILGVENPRRCIDVRALQISIDCYYYESKD